MSPYDGARGHTGSPDQILSPTTGSGGRPRAPRRGITPPYHSLTSTRPLSGGKFQEVLLVLAPIARVARKVAIGVAN